MDEHQLNSTDYDTLTRFVMVSILYITKLSISKQCSYSPPENSVVESRA